MAYRAALVGLLLLLAQATSAEIYKCIDEDGKLHYSDKPCGAEAEVVQFDDASNGITLGSDADWSKINEANRERSHRRAIDQAIGRHQTTINRLQNARDRELAKLRRDKQIAANNLAGATYRKSIAMEMQAVAENYNSRINMERQAIQDLRAQH